MRKLQNLEVHWLTANAPWDPLGFSEVLDPTLPVPLVYIDKKFGIENKIEDYPYV